MGRTVTDLVIPNGMSARYPGKLYDSTIRVDALHQVRWYRERRENYIPRPLCIRTGFFIYVDEVPKSKLLKT